MHKHSSNDVMTTCLYNTNKILCAKIVSKAIFHTITSSPDPDIFQHGKTNSNGCSQIKTDYKISIIQESLKVGFTVNSPSCTDASLYLVSISLSVIECNIYVIVKG